VYCIEEIVGVVMREAKKEALPYRRHAVQVMGQVAEAFQSDMFPAIYEMLQPLFQTKEDEMEEDEEEQEKRQQLETLELHEAAILALGRAFPSDSTAQGDIRSIYLRQFQNLFITLNELYRKLLEFVHGVAAGRCSQYHAPSSIIHRHISASSGWPYNGHFSIRFPQRSE
jgi:hypothetical protein